MILSNDPDHARCVALAGDLGVIDAPNTGSSFANTIQWDRSADGRVFVVLYHGIDAGYRLDLVIRNGSLTGIGGLYRAGRAMNSVDAVVHGVRVAPSVRNRCDTLP